MHISLLMNCLKGKVLFSFTSFFVSHQDFVILALTLYTLSEKIPADCLMWMDSSLSLRHRTLTVCSHIIFLQPTHTSHSHTSDMNLSDRMWLTCSGSRRLHSSSITLLQYGGHLSFFFLSAALYFLSVVGLNGLLVSDESLMRHRPLRRMGNTMRRTLTRTLCGHLHPGNLQFNFIRIVAFLQPHVWRGKTAVEVRWKQEYL